MCAWDTRAGGCEGHVHVCVRGCMCVHGICVGMCRGHVCDQVCICQRLISVCACTVRACMGGHIFLCM